MEHGHLRRRRGNRIRLIDHIAFPHSLGLLYSAFTYYCGFKVNSGEYKLMGLAPYGQPIYQDLILEQLIDLKPDGSFWLDMEYFNYCQGLTMTSERFHELFGGPPRAPESPLEQRHMDLAASIQAVTEEVVLRIGRHVHAQTGMKHLVLAGGVALNCVANGRLLREGPFDDLWIQPAAGDAGGALGAALFVWHQLLDKPRRADGPRQPAGQLPRPALQHRPDRAVPGTAGAARPAVRRARPSCSSTSPGCWPTARSSAGSRAGWSSARGPSGARSILGDPRSPGDAGDDEPQDQVPRELPPVRAVRAAGARRASGSTCDPGQESPYMLLVAPVREEHRVADRPPTQLRTMQDDPRPARPGQRRALGRSRRSRTSTTAPGSRPSTSERNPRFHRLLRGVSSA